MWALQLKAMKDLPPELALLKLCYGKHTTTTSTPPPLHGLWRVTGWRLSLTFRSVFKEAHLRRGTNELSQQPSADFGCGARTRAAEEGFLFWIFAGCEQHAAPNELSDMQLSGAWKPNVQLEITASLWLMLIDPDSLLHKKHEMFAFKNTDLHTAHGKAAQTKCI